MALFCGFITIMWKVFIFWNKIFCDSVQWLVNKSCVRIFVDDSSFTLVAPQFATISIYIINFYIHNQFLHTKIFKYNNFYLRQSATKIHWPYLPLTNPSSSHLEPFWLSPLLHLPKGSSQVGSQSVSNVSSSPKSSEK